MSQPAQRPAASHRFNPTIFREYDIRGVVGQTLHEADAYQIGRAFGSVAREKDPQGLVCVGRDGRLTSPAMMEAACRGIADSGMKVQDIGLGPTPMLYYAAYTQKAAGGMMITGSHNPPDHNGFKFMLQNRAFYGQAIQALRDIAEKGSYSAGQGEITRRELKEEYLGALLEAYRGTRELKVAWDAGNGATGEMMQMLCAKLPGTHTLLNETIDGTFPAHHPDPTVPENLRQIIAAVKGKLDAGIAFDGDGDRLGVIDDEGEILWGDQLLMLYAAEILKEKPGATIIADVKASGALFDEIARLGGNPLMWKTGHSLIKSKMAETGCPLAGEMSGHLFFADRYYGFDDALYAAVRLLSLLSNAGRKLSELRKGLPSRINTPEMRFECDDVRKFAVIEEVRGRLEKQGRAFSAVDGMRVGNGKAWWLLRASNTQAVLVARCEAMDQAGVDAQMAELREQLAASGVALPENPSAGH